VTGAQPVFLIDEENSVTSTQNHETRPMQRTGHRRCPELPP
jgi:hypothetical protein